MGSATFKLREAHAQVPKGMDVLKWGFRHVPGVMLKSLGDSAFWLGSQF